MFMTYKSLCIFCFEKNQIYMLLLERNHFLSHKVLFIHVGNSVCTDNLRKNLVCTKYLQEKILRAPSLAIYLICAHFHTYQRI